MIVANRKKLLHLLSKDNICWFIWSTYVMMLSFNGNTQCLDVIPTSLCLLQSWFLGVITHPCHFSFTLAHDVCDLMQIKKKLQSRTCFMTSNNHLFTTSFSIGIFKVYHHGKLRREYWVSFTKHCWANFQVLNLWSQLKNELLPHLQKNG